MSELDVQVELRLKNNLSKEAAAALKAMGREAKAAGDAVGKAGKSGGGELAREADDAARAYRETARAVQDMERAVRQAGGAGQAFARGLASARSAASAIARDAKAISRNLGRRFDGLAQIGAGAAAGGWAAKQALEKPMAYESRLAAMANVAFSDRKTEGRIAGMRDLDALIVKAVRAGGGSRENAAEALNTVLASGLGMDTASKLLPVITRAATASQADPNELAAILTKGISQKAFTADDAERVIDMAVAAGQAGQFELRDMARWLPQIIAGGAGMKNLEGYAMHLANVQGIANVTGSADQAGNAYVNLLGKLTSTDAAGNAKKELRIDLGRELAAARMQGVDPVTAFAAIAQKVVGKNRAYQQIQAKIAATDDKDEKSLLMQQASEILMGSALGKIIQDREAMLGLVGIMTQQDTIKAAARQIAQSEGATQTGYEVMAATSEFKLQQAANEKDIAASGLFETLKEPMDRLVTSTAELAQAFPNLTTAAYGAASVFGVVAAARGAAQGAGILFGMGRGAAAGADAAGASKGIITGAADALAARGATTASKLLRIGGRAAAPLAVGGTVLDVYNTETDDTLTRAQKNARHAESVGGLAGALAGAKIGAAGGAAAGSIVPGLGTAAGGLGGAIIGGIAGFFGGSEIGGWLGKKLFGDDEDKAASAPAPAPTPAPQPGQPPITLQSQLVVDGRVLAEAVNQYNGRQGMRY